ncbi:hypothetical protein [Luteolibacter sp. AS25]|uniref:hypothetical protein n=1 Tax=Luteolibacter sp. AS25 TaxID=3135776 RepID=UPI00398A529C
MRAIISALASVGDDFFASVLATRSGHVQQSEERFVSRVWKYSKLEYPKTQEIYEKHKQSEAEMATLKKPSD